MGFENFCKKVYDETQFVCFDMLKSAKESGLYVDDLEVIRKASAEMATLVTKHVADIDICRSLVSDTYGKSMRPIRIMYLGSSLSSQIQSRLTESLPNFQQQYKGDLTLLIQEFASIVATSIIGNHSIQAAAICYVMEQTRSANKEAA